MAMRFRLLILMLCFAFSSFAQEVYLFIGTYTGTGSKGIYVYRFNTNTGKATWVSNTDSLINPSFLTLSTNGKYLYSVTESAREYPGKVSAFSFDKTTGKLTFLNARTSGGDNPCYVSVTKNGKWVAVGNYTGGNLSIFRTNTDGSLKTSGQFIQHTGKGPNVDRQEKPHVHSVVFSPDEKVLFVSDLGIDKIMTYKFSPNTSKPLSPAAKPFVTAAAGSGPRHLTFHPKLPYGYLMQEMAGNVIAYKYANGTLTETQSIAAHPADFKGAISSADIHISPDGKFLYASNRGDENTIAIFSINQDDGRLTLVGTQSTLGTTPRNFAIDPTGTFLLAANQTSGNIVIFKRDKETGLLSPTGDEINISKPVCLKMF